ncbi:MAG TPA: hypothetical protein VNJ01_03920 [Bacteriovoracaceae bacterium]|nr:hypothetical protein [Bacteriovoracaceae bacterium]
MRYLLALFIILFSAQAFAVGCDCEVWVYTPMTGSQKIDPMNLRTFTLEEFSSNSHRNQLQCRQLCHQRYLDDMSSSRLRALLIIYGQTLIQQQKLGYNCTGLTTLKFPVRVKARLGAMGLGNVTDIIEVVNHEEVCF